MRSRAAWSAGWPRISIVPESGPRTFITMRRVVVLPAPFGPSRPNTLPRGTSRDRSLTATWPANALVTPRRRIAVSFTGSCSHTGRANRNTPNWPGGFGHGHGCGAAPQRPAAPDGTAKWHAGEYGRHARPLAGTLPRYIRLFWKSARGMLRTEDGPDKIVEMPL